MYELKPLSSHNIPSALKKAERYRLLGEPREVESICDDILAVDPDNREAIILKLLAITDRFVEDVGDEVDEAKEMLPLLKSEYHEAFFAGVICERRGKVIFAQRPEAGPAVYDWLDKAMKWYDVAERHNPDGNDDARLRWNTCARMINNHPGIKPPPGPPSGEFRAAKVTRETH